ncbi:transposase [Peribacillus butanolivorans]|uniref:transposase n=1 Tax=Peribacillus butanolivorans TaxID=421767 RepID=UPI0036C3E66E
MTFIQYTFGIRSMRKTIEEVEKNMAYRWFLGYGFQRAIASTNHPNTLVRHAHFYHSVQKAKTIKKW